MKKFSFLALLIWGQSFAQEITVRQGQGLKDKDTVHFMDFMDVSLAKFEFEGPELMGKSPTVLVKELRDGKVLRIDTLLNGDAPYLKISKAQYGLSFFTEIRDEVLRTFMRSEKYGAGKRKFALDKDLYGYALKDFFGAKQELRYKVGEQIPLLAVITPHDQGNGFASYCEVVQTDVRPEDLGRHFGIPHYFLVFICFK